MENMNDFSRSLIFFYYILIIFSLCVILDASKTKDFSKDNINKIISNYFAAISFYFCCFFVICVYDLFAELFKIILFTSVTYFTLIMWSYTIELATFLDYIPTFFMEYLFARN